MTYVSQYISILKFFFLLGICPLSVDPTTNKFCMTNLCLFYTLFNASVQAIIIFSKLILTYLDDRDDSDRNKTLTLTLQLKRLFIICSLFLFLLFTIKSRRYHRDFLNQIDGLSLPCTNLKFTCVNTGEKYF